MATKRFCDVCGKEVDFKVDENRLRFTSAGVEFRVYSPTVFFCDPKKGSDCFLCWPCVRDAIDREFPRGEE